MIRFNLRIEILARERQRYAYILGGQASQYMASLSNAIDYQRLTPLGCYYAFLF
jgi:hypothetical protein